ncbi:porin family protein [Microbulbifer sp. OS29]|uniref:Porin family protein n=1 Tax=Microbulbifer okhotskensis TaxID=2926617 RepID=A0A9X2EM46_9GAMM|nr:outer membrane beta-barrel protein [Microbulbifer okhotskensis]MCO1333605.1 porin family protein [Microbulbifer okhotskensis]
MSKIRKWASLLALIISPGVIAEGTYWGAVAGLADFDFSGVDNPVNLGIRTGYTRSSGLGVEVEYMGSVFSGEAQVYGRGEDVELQSLAAYATYRTEGDWYIKGRLGALYEDVSVGRKSSDDFGVSVGAGVGFKLSENYRLELEYTMIEKDIGFWSGGFSVRF